jgi:hypothetical protein
MADYYSQGTLTSEVLLTPDLVTVLEARGATLHADGDGETVLDALVTGKMPRRLYGVTWPEGWRNPCGVTVEDFMEEIDLEEANDAVKELILLEDEDILHEVLKINPDTDILEMNESWSCSKMRLDGFGGRSLMVNRKGYLHIGTARYHEDEDGVLVPDNAFRFWKDEPGND